MLSPLDLCTQAIIIKSINRHHHAQTGGWQQHFDAWDKESLTPAAKREIPGVMITLRHEMYRQLQLAQRQTT